MNYATATLYTMRGARYSALSVDSKHDCFNGIAEYYVVCNSATEDLLEETGQLLTLDLRQRQHALSLCLIAKSISLSPAQCGEKTVTLELQSPLQVLVERTCTRHYIETPLLDILVDILQSNTAFVWPYKFMPCIENVIIPFVVQHNESDWEFWRRLCALYGVKFVFDCRDSRGLIVFRQYPSGNKVRFNLPLEEMSLSKEFSLLACKQIFFYCPMQPRSSNAEGDNLRQDDCLLCYYCADFCDGGAARQLDLMRQRLSWQSTVILARCTAVWLVVGDIIQLELGDFRIICVDRLMHTSYAKKSGHTVRASTSTTLVLLPVDVPFQQCCETTSYLPEALWLNELSYRPMMSESVSLKKSLFGVTCATISCDGHTPRRNAHGHYACDFLYPSKPQYLASLTPSCGYAGDDGARFDYPRGASVILGHIENDVNRPFIIGGFFAKLSDVAAREAKRLAHSMTTPSDLRFCIDDSAASGGLCFRSKHNLVMLAESTKTSGIKLQTTGRLTIRSYIDFRLSIAHEWRVSVKLMSINTAFQHAITCTRLSEVQSGSDLNMFAKQSVYLMADDLLYASSAETLLACASQSIKAEQLMMQGGQGGIDFDGETCLTFQSGNALVCTVNDRQTLHIHDTGVELIAPRNFTLRAKYIDCKNSLWLS